MVKVICQGCGTTAVCQANEMMNGRSDMYACPNGCNGGGYKPIDDIMFEILEN